MEQYLIYVAFASATIASPGPGVVFTITNSLRYGFWGAISGIFGVSLGILCIATISASSLSIFLATSALAFTALKFIGAAYLIYLGVKMWLSSAKIDVYKIEKQKSHKLRFTEGLMITLLNPKAIFFFIALFPQFITLNEDYQSQFIILTITFSFLIILIHCIYAVFSKAAKSSLSTPKGSKLVSRVSGSFYIFFGVGLVASNK